VPSIMSERKECPLCGESMHRTERVVPVQVPGNPRPSPTTVREWVCPECDYFEEVDEEEA
jgi:transposase